jgi:predicted XRE-type DNA-binding protein
MLLYDKFKGSTQIIRTVQVSHTSTALEEMLPRPILPWEDQRMKNQVQPPAYAISWKSADTLGQPLENESVTRLRTELYAEILRCAQHYSQKELQVIFHEPQPRVSELLHGRIAGKSLEKLMYYAARLGIEVRTTFERRSRSLEDELRLSEGHNV